MPGLKRSRSTVTTTVIGPAKAKKLKATSTASWNRQLRQLRSSNGFPVKANVKLKYSATISLNAGANSRAINSFRANSVFDPDFTGVGHQPLGFDQWAAVYGAYRVTKCTVTARTVPDAASSTTPSGFCLMAHNTTGEITSISAGLHSISEQGDRSKILIGGSFSASVTGKQIQSVSYTMDLAKYNGKPLDADDTAVISENPANVNLITLVQQSINLNDPGEQTYLVDIVYDVEFMEPKRLAQS